MTTKSNKDVRAEIARLYVTLPTEIDRARKTMSTFRDLLALEVSWPRDDKKAFQDLKDEVLKFIQVISTKSSELSTTTSGCKNLLSHWHFKGVEELAEEVKSERDGYETGLRWKDSYRPGGPAVYFFREGEGNTYNKANGRTWEEQCRLSQNCAVAWFKGFDKGIETRAELGLMVFLKK